MTSSKLISLTEAITLRQSIETLVFTNGHFDLLHAGHVDYLQKARALGDALFVGLNSDRSTAALKGPKRPLTPQPDRARTLAALEYVDAVIIFDELTAHHLLEALQPEIYAKGGDYVLDPNRRGTLLPEAPVVQSYGGYIELIPYQAGYSTSELINRIVERYCD
ncbi:MAG TPA: adenylyltransferase/cytidyltransferase family protein [Chloroflexi bacterium]|nr:adenylyltransferase/cytidyltransferase family protein [Chloroflexota bacterium]